MNRGRFFREIVPDEFLSSTPQSNREILSRTSFQSCCVSHMKISNVHVGTIYRMRIALQFLCQFTIFISVCNSHFLVYGSYVDVCYIHMDLQFSYQFAILTSRLQNFFRTWLHMDSHVATNLNS